ncbi:MAG: rRNA methyltransferase [Clostridia bacterium]|nr:rRNA methyltransferase [Clostridia bacterium]
MNAILDAALARVLEECDSRALERDARAISENYRLRTGTGKRLLTREGEAAAYAAARMPATCAAAEAALGYALAAAGLSPRTLLDVGAGTGAVSWAADSLLELEGVVCLEREEAMRGVGARLMQDAGGALAAASWQAFDITSAQPLPHADLAAEGYMIGELEEGMRLPAARKLFAAADQMALFIEPGTPQGFANLRMIRDALLSEGAYIAAPCPQGTQRCPMAGDDWCHFTVRVQRTRLHKALKGGSAPYEDEKFAYLALTKTPPQAACAARVLRHPLIAPGRITLTLCGGGETHVQAVTKKDPLWKRARKIGAGDAL